MLVAAMAVGAACVPVPPSSQVEFSCAIVGEKYLQPPTSAQAVCERLKASFDRRLGITTRLVDGTGKSPQDPGEWVRVHVEFASPGMVHARVTRRHASTVTDYPELSIAVSDRHIGLDTVEQLASQLADQL